MGISAEKWLEAQQGVLGSALIDPATVPIVLSQTDAKDYSGVNLAVFQAMRSLFSSGQIVDPITVADKLGGGSSSYLVQLMEITPTAAHVQTYIDICSQGLPLAGNRQHDGCYVRHGRAAETAGGCDRN